MKKLTVNSKSLLEALKKFKTIIKAHAVLPLLECVLIEVDDKHKISVSGTNLETHMKCFVEGRAELPFIMIIPFKTLLSIVSSQPSSPITIAFDDINMMATITCENANYEIGCPDKDFIAFPELSELLTYREMSKKIIEDCEKALLFTSNDMLRPAMTGLYFDYSRKSLKIVSTDAHCLYASDVYDSPFFDARGFIIPASAIKIMCAVGKKEFGQIGFYDSHSTFFNEQTVILSKLVDVRFPEYEAIIPLHKKFFSVNRSALMQAIKSLMPVANDSTKQITFEVDGTLKLEANDIDFGYNGVKELALNTPCDLKYYFGFNGANMLSILSACNSNNINIYNDGNNAMPFIFKEGDEKSTILGMPLMIQAA